MAAFKALQDIGVSLGFRMKQFESPQAAGKWEKKNLAQAEHVMNVQRQTHSYRWADLWQLVQGVSECSKEQVTAMFRDELEYDQRLSPSELTSLNIPQEGMPPQLM